MCRNSREINSATWKSTSALFPWSRSQQNCPSHVLLTLFSNCKMCWVEGLFPLKPWLVIDVCVCVCPFIYPLFGRTPPPFQKEPAHLPWVCPTRLFFKVKYLLSFASECVSAQAGARFYLIINFNDRHTAVPYYIEVCTVLKFDPSVFWMLLCNLLFHMQF